MASSPNLLIFGASARAAAFSALRAGMQPSCADLFADLDLQARCPVMRVEGSSYPYSFLDLIQLELPGPWMYTGGIENRPELVAAMARQRTLWGNNSTILSPLRRPEACARMLRSRLGPALCSALTLGGIRSVLALLFRSRGFVVPRVWYSPLGRLPRQGRWLIKPRAGAGGTGIRFLTPALPSLDFGRHYLQEFIEGPSCAAVYVGTAEGARLLGATSQLVGESWLHAAPFHYCGSIGPLEFGSDLRWRFERLGDVLSAAFVPRGLFGIDCVLRDGVPYPVEVNPRYTASVEVIEYATGVAALAWHRRAFDPDAPEPKSRPAAAPVVGKAILFARAPLTFPADGPWTATLRQPGDVWDLPAFADIPAAGTPIRAGRPVLTFFAGGNSVADCRAALQRIAADLDARLYSC